MSRGQQALVLVVALIIVAGVGIAALALYQSNALAGADANATQTALHDPFRITDIELTATEITARNNAVETLLAATRNP